MSIILTSVLIQLCCFSYGMKHNTIKTLLTYVSINEIHSTSSKRFYHLRGLPQEESLFIDT